MLDSRFTQWRPTSHFIAPKNWMNDPCGPFYDEQTATFHLAYQYNPYGATWGNMTWMHATSKDLIHWTHLNKDPTLAPEIPHDLLGVYSGCILPRGPRGQAEQLTAIYTAISDLPINFKLPYKWGAEKLALAVSNDKGRTWQRNESSVILSHPPEEYKGQVIGWRDPYISSWPAMDVQLRHKSGEFLYGLISGGLKDKTPTAFLYQVRQDNLQKWKFISAIADLGLFHQLHPQNGNMGVSWEVCNFFSIENHEYFLMNVEGVGSDEGGKYAMWAQVSLHGPHLTPVKSAMCDHGCLYATTTFLHEPSQRRIMWGWITEHDLAEKRYEEQGWAGCMSLPREVLLLTYDNVDSSIREHTSSMSAFQVISDGDKDSLKLQTLGFRPVEETQGLRAGAIYIQLKEPVPQRLKMSSRNFEMKLTIAMESTKGTSEAEIGLLICHNESLSRYTKIVYREEAIYIDRSHSTLDPDVNTSTITAPIKLLPYADGTLESLQMHLFVDNSVVELFVNNRVVITTRIYCDDPDSTGVSLISSSDVHAHFLSLEAWIGLQTAMMD